MEHGHPDHGFARMGELFVLVAQMAIAVEPPHRAFNNPAFRKHSKALGGIGPVDNLQVHRPMPPAAPSASPQGPPHRPDPPKCGAAGKTYAGELPADS